MSMDEPETPTVPDMPDGWNLITDQRVSSGGRLYLRAEACNRYGIEEADDVLDMIVRTEDGEEVFVPEVEVGDSYRVLIPSRRRKRYDIEDGDIVDVAVRHADQGDG